MEGGGSNANRPPRGEAHLRVSDDAAGVNVKALSTYMGTASITITYDRYGHLLPGNEEEAAALLDAHLQGAARVGESSG